MGLWTLELLVRFFQSNYRDGKKSSRLKVILTASMNSLISRTQIQPNNSKNLVARPLASFTRKFIPKSQIIGQQTHSHRLMMKNP